MCKKKSANDVAKRLLTILPQKGYSQLVVDHTSLKKWACRECGPTFMAAVVLKMESLAKNDLFYNSDKPSQVSVSFNSAHDEQPGSVLITSPYSVLLSMLGTVGDGLLQTVEFGTDFDGISGTTSKGIEYTMTTIFKKSDHNTRFDFNDDAESEEEDKEEEETDPSEQQQQTSLTLRTFMKFKKQEYNQPADYILNNTEGSDGVVND